MLCCCYIFLQQPAGSSVAAAHQPNISTQSSSGICTHTTGNAGAAAAMKPVLQASFPDSSASTRLEVLSAVIMLLNNPKNLPSCMTSHSCCASTAAATA